MTHLPQFQGGRAIDEYVPNFPDDEDMMLDAEAEADDEATQPVVVTARDLYGDMHPRDYLLTPQNVIRLEAEEAWAPGEAED